MLDACCSRVSISQDYWGDIKEKWRSGGWSPPVGAGAKSPRSWSFFVKLHIIFALLKYNKQQLLLLPDNALDAVATDVTRNVVFLSVCLSVSHTGLLVCLGHGLLWGQGTTIINEGPNPPQEGTFFERLSSIFNSIVKCRILGDWVKG